MKDQAPDETVIERLRIAISTDALPTAARDHANHLLKRLSSPVRVTLLGKPKAGKSELVNMFVGRRLIPRDATLPTLELVHGPTEKMSVTTADGSIRSTDEIDLDDPELARAAFLKISLPIPLLERVSLLEVVTVGGAGALSAAVDWAVRRTDIALWCSQDFDATEQTVWARVPDALKDHAFLVLSKADVLSANRQLSERVATLETVVSEEFHSLFAVATLQAIKAHKADGSIDEAMRHASGGGALTSEILRHAERGRRADIDSAELFLARYHVPAGAPGISALPADEQIDVAPPQPVPEINAPPPVSEPETPQAEPQRAKEDTTPIRNVTLFTDAVHFLRRRGEGLAGRAAKLGEGQANGLMDQCVDAVEHLVDLFSQDDSGCAVADAFLDDLTDAADLMVLMQVESGDAPPADAVTLLLQLRRGMEDKLAA